MTASPRASERSERRRREVCQAALRVITREGLEVTTLRDISREGGFTTGVLSHYFPDKEAVIAGAFAAAS
jgi:AcrR family transcriptional regulator